MSDNYDANGHPVSQTIDGGAATSFSYDGAGNLMAVGPSRSAGATRQAW